MIALPFIALIRDSSSWRPNRFRPCRHRYLWHLASKGRLEYCPGSSEKLIAFRRRLQPDHHSHVHSNGLFLFVERPCPRPLYTAASNWLSHIRGGLAIATVFACGIFGAMSGASVAAAAVMAPLAMTNMRRLGYSEVLAAGSVSVGATLDILIPPSVPMVIYGLATQTSIGRLLVAGVIPGIILGILLDPVYPRLGHH